MTLTRAIRNSAVAVVKGVFRFSTDDLVSIEFSPVVTFIIICQWFCLSFLLFLSYGVVLSCLWYGLLIRSLESSLLKSNIVPTSSIPPKWCSFKLEFTSNSTKRKSKIRFSQFLVDHVPSSAIVDWRLAGWDFKLSLCCSWLCTASGYFKVILYLPKPVIYPCPPADFPYMQGTDQDVTFFHLVSHLSELKRFILI